MPRQFGLQFQRTIRSRILFGSQGGLTLRFGFLQQALERNFRFSRHFLLQLKNSPLNLNIFQQSGASGFGRMIGGAIAGYTVSLSRSFSLPDLLGKALVTHIFNGWHYRSQSCKRFSMRLCWADKVPLALFGLITLSCWCLADCWDRPDTQFCRYLRLDYPDWTSADSYCFVTAAQHWSAFLSIEWILFLKIIAPIWVITRLLTCLAVAPPSVTSIATLVPSPQTTADIDLTPQEWRRVEPDWLQRLRRPG